MQAVGDAIIIRPNKPDLVSVGGIALLEGRKLATPSEGVVIAVGPGRYAKDGTRAFKPRVEVGNRVVFNSFSKTAVEWRRGGDLFLTCKEEDILSVIADDTRTVAIARMR